LRQVLSFVAFVLACGLVFVLAGCERDLAPPLVELTSLEPREVDTLDRLELRGAGFPQGRRARVTFRGDVHRAGETEVRGASIEAEGVVASPERIEVLVTEALEERFCGRPEHAAHATFAGEVEVAFASSAAGAPPLAGTKRGILLDVRPSSTRPDVALSRTRESKRFLDYMGIRVGAPTPRGFPVEAVDRTSVAERHGIVVGDLLASLDGVRLLETTDLAPSSARAVRLGIGRDDGAPPDVRTIPLVGYAGERIPSELAPAFVVAGLALSAVLLLVLPGPASLVATELRLASRVRRTTWRALVAALFGRGPVALVSAVATVLVSTFALGPHVLAADLDGAVLLVTSIGLLFVSRLSVARGRFAFLKTLSRFVLPAALLVGALVGAVVSIGAYRLPEVVRVQGVLPWEQTFARSPACAALAFAYVASLLAITRVRSDGGAALGEAAPRRARFALEHAAVLERLAVLFASALGVAVFFGGWQVGAEDGAGLGLVVLGAALFALKSWALAGALLGSASLGASWSWPEALSFSLRRVLPALGVASALLAASRAVTPPASLEAAFGATLVAGITLVVFRTTWRVRAALGRPEPQASPFL
jgi:NADH-quinone oxidoreductase subunit H